MMQGVILDFDSVGPADLDLSKLYELPVKWTVYSHCLPSEVTERIADADIVLINKTPILAPQIKAAKRLKFISIFATGTNIIDLETAKAHKIVVSNAVKYGTGSVVQHVWSLILALTTNLDGYRQAAMDGRWEDSEFFCFMDFSVRELQGKILGIVGAGELGCGVAKIAEAFGMEVIFASLPGRVHSHQPNRMPLNSLLSKADIVSLHCPLTETTEKLIGEKELGLMPSTSLLINTSRGALIDEPALRQALIEERIAGAALDVLSVEPPVDGNVLLDESIPNLIITPHVAWIAQEARQRLIDQVARNVESFLQGKPQNQVV
ncbi:MAG: D-2-hydroxyacid dehydrogenase [Porticoccaceae bacterium]|nr:D-2-hydroxyacid dehydrogenase [Porticoccaceae bacterium]